MQTTTQVRFGPDFTPPAIKKLMIWVASVSLISAIINPIFTRFFEIPGPQEWLALSWRGLSSLLLWQPLTYTFIQPVGFGISFFFLLQLAFTLYIIWVMGTDILEHIGSKKFLRFYFGIGILSGLLTLLMMPIFRQYMNLAGTTPIIYALLTIWAFTNPNRELLLFFLIPVKALWLVLGLFGVSLLINLSQLNLIGAFFTLSGPLLGYLWALVEWGVHSPFTKIYSFELKIVRFSERIRRLFYKSKGSGEKVVHFHPETEVKSDEAFVDEMLEKISKYGQGSLTKEEQKRLNEIASKKKG